GLALLAGLAGVAALVAAALPRRRLARLLPRQSQAGQVQAGQAPAPAPAAPLTRARLAPLGAAAAALALAFGLGLRLGLDLPQPGRFRASGGMAVSPEYVALMLALTVNTAAYIGEIIRGAIESLPRGQWEAAASLGLRRGHQLGDVILPQVFRIV